MPLNERFKKVLSFLLRIGLSAALLVYLFSKIDTAQMADTLKNAELSFVFIAAVVFFVIHIFLLLRWIIFIKALHLHLSLQNIVSCFFIGLFFNLFLPTSTGGDIVKTWFLFKGTDQKAKVVASVVADRLCGFISIVLVATVAFIFGYRLLKDNSLFLLIGKLATISFGTTFILINERLYSFFCQVFRRFPAIEEKLMSFHYAIALLKDKPLALLSTVGLSCFSQLLLSISFYFVAKALHQDIPYIYFLIFCPLICVVASLPSIGGLGVRDLGTAYLFAKVGMKTGTAVSMSLINFSFMVLVGLIGGVFYVIALSPGRLQRDQADTGVSSSGT